MRTLITFASALVVALSASLAAAKPTHKPVEIDPTFGQCTAIDLATGGTALVCETVAKRAPKASKPRIIVRVGQTTVQHVRG
jgi:hypothetical protein